MSDTTKTIDKLQDLIGDDFCVMEHRVRPPYPLTKKEAIETITEALLTAGIANIRPSKDLSGVERKLELAPLGTGINAILLDDKTARAVIEAVQFLKQPPAQQRKEFRLDKKLEAIWQLVIHKSVPEAEAIRLELKNSSTGVFADLTFESLKDAWKNFKKSNPLDDGSELIVNDMLEDARINRE